VATRNIVLSLGTALAVVGTALAVDWRTAMPAAIAVLQAYNQYENRSSKVMKARGTTLNRAARMAMKDPRIESPDIARYLAAGIVRKGDLGRVKKGKRSKSPARKRAR
jgi:hypothetical protein